MTGVEPAVRAQPLTGRWLALVLSVVVTGLLATAVAVQGVRHADAVRNQAFFDKVARGHQLAWRNALAERARLLAAVEGLFSGAALEPGRAAFRGFVAPLVRVHPDIRAVAWLPRVAPEARPELEARARRAGLERFQIRGRDAGGGGAAHLPVLYAEPGTACLALAGLDVAAGPAGRELLEGGQGAALRVAASAELGVSHPRFAEAVWLLRPVPGREGPLSDSGEDRLRGYVALAFDLERLAAGVGEGLAPVALRLLGPEGMPLLARGLPGDDRIGSRLPLAVGPRTWQLRMAPTADWLARHGMDRRPGVVGLGLTLTLGSAAMLLSLRRRSDQVRALVAQRTAELRDSEARLRAVFEGMVDGLITIDAHGVVQSFNPPAERMFGYRASEVVGKSASLLMPEPHRSRHDELVRGYRGGRPSRVIGQARELSARRRGGEIFPVELSVAEMSIGGRRLFSGIVRDLSARKAAEADRDRLVNMVDTNPDVIAAFTPHGEPLFMNRAGRRLLDREGLAGPELLARLASPELRAALEAERGRAGSEDMVWTGESTLSVPGHGEVPVAQQVVLHRTAEPPYVSVFLRDISLQKRTEAELLRAKSDAEEAASVKSEFVATVSHEIRTPLNGILGMAQLLQGTALSPRQAEYVQVLASSSQALLDIIGDILDFSRLEAGKLHLSEGPFDLEQLLHGVLQLVAPRAGAKGVALRILYPAEMPRRWVGDAGRLRQVVLNLVGNAVKFTESGRVLVRAGLRPGGDGIAVSVEDTGIGIRPEQRPRLFQAFSQAESTTTRRFGGTGLGLSISRRLLELMEGRIDYDSSPGSGSRFWFEVPLRRDPGEEAPARPGAGLEALLMLAEAEERAGWEGRLARLGFSVQACGDPEALVAALARAPGAALLVTGDRAEGWGPERLAALLEAREASPPGAMLVLTDAADDGNAWQVGEIPVATLGRLAGPLQLEQAVRGLLGGEAVPRGEGAEPPAAGGSGCPRVLVAEDNAVNARVAAAMLERLGVEAEVVGDGRAAVGRWERGDVDLILMDCRMPELDGLDATRAIRDRERGGRVPVVALTANVLTQDRDRCFAAGMDGILGKPFRQEELAEVLLRHLPAYRPPAGPARGAGGANPGRPRTVDGDKLAELRELMGPELEALVAAYLEDAEALLQRIGACVEEDGPAGDELLRLVHTLKSSSANVGARRLSEQARRLELRLRAGEPLEPAQLEGLAEIWAATRGQLQASLQPAAAP